MKFILNPARYAFSSAALGTVTIYGVDVLARCRRLMGLAFLTLGSSQIYSLCKQYWEIADYSMLRSQRYGFNLAFPLSELRYAGPVREGPGSLFREEGH